MALYVPSAHEDNNVINRELAAEILIECGITVELVNNGRDALMLLESEDFDGVLMDCQIPVMDGYQATAKIREHERFKDLPVDSQCNELGARKDVFGWHE